MATLKDIAHQLNISTMTVSRALNTPHLVKEELRQQIQEVAKELDYKPNQAAKSLVSNKTGIIQVSISRNLDSTDPYFMTLLAGIADYLSEKFYSIIVRRDYEMINKCDGLIMMGLSKGEDKEFYETLTVPTVLFGKTDYPIDYIDINNVQGVRDITNYLISLGHRHIGFVGMEYDEEFTKERLDGYLLSLKENHIPIRSEYIINAKNHHINAAKDVCQSLFENEEMTAIVCATDILALGIMEGVKEQGYNIPNDYSIVGFDGLYVNRLAVPHLTTVVQPLYEIGRDLGRVLLERIANEQKEKEEKIYDLKFCIGETTGSPRTK